MTNPNAPSDRPDKDAAPASPPLPKETKNGAQPLNPATVTPAAPAANQKPVVEPAPQRRLEKLLNAAAQSAPTTSSADKARSAPAPTAPTQPEKKEPPAADKRAAPPAPPAKDAQGLAGKKLAWPHPAKTLGETSSLVRPEAPTPAPPAPRESTPAVAGTARLNRPPADPNAGALPVEASPGDSGLPARSKAELRAAMRTTSATRNVPKGRVAQEVWKVIFQAMTGSQVKELQIEVKGLSVVGRSDPDSKAKADLDLTSLNAGAYGVSRQHVIIVPTDEGPCIIDMNSTNGTWINGLYLEPGRRYRLRTNDRVELGSLKLLVRVMSPAEQKAP